MGRGNSDFESILELTSELNLSRFQVLQRGKLQSCTKPWDSSIMTTIDLNTIPSAQIFFRHTLQYYNTMQYNTMEIPEISWGSKHECWWWASLLVSGLLPPVLIYIKQFSVSTSRIITSWSLSGGFSFCKFDTAVDLDIYHTPCSDYEHEHGPFFPVRIDRSPTEPVSEESGLACF